MSNDSGAAMGAAGGERLDRALEAVENMAAATEDNLKGSFVFVTALFTFFHTVSWARTRQLTGSAGVWGWFVSLFEFSLDLAAVSSLVASAALGSGTLLGLQ
jgi:hypothetical protein